MFFVKFYAGYIAVMRRINNKARLKSRAVHTRASARRYIILALFFESRYFGATAEYTHSRTQFVDRRKRGRYA